MKKKYWNPKRKAELSIQFYHDKEGVENMTITANPTDKFEMINFYIFAGNLFHSEYIDDNMRDCLYELCKTFVKKYEQTN